MQFDAAQNTCRGRVWEDYILCGGWVREAMRGEDRGLAAKSKK